MASDICRARKCECSAGKEKLGGTRMRKGNCVCKDIHTNI